MVLPAVAFALDGGGWTVGKGEWYSEASAARAYANGTFFVDGRDGAIQPAGRFQQVEVRSYNEIGWRKNLALILELPFTTNTWRFNRQTASISGLSDLRLGLRVRLRDDAPGLVLEGGWRAPLGYDKNVFPRLGDGRQKAWGSLHGGLRLPFAPGFVQASRGFLFVSEEGTLYSTTSVDAGLWFGSNVLLAGRYADQLGWNATQEGQTLETFYAAGPLLMVRIDDHLDLSMGAMRRLAGRNTLEGTQIYVALGMKQSKLTPMQGFLGTKLH